MGDRAVRERVGRLLSGAGPRVGRGEDVVLSEVVQARTGNGRLQLTSREIADVQRLVDALVARLPRGLEVVELELELARVARTDPATPDPGAAGQSNGRTRNAGRPPTARKRTGAAGDRGASTSLGIVQSRRSERFAPVGGRG